MVSLRLGISISLVAMICVSSLPANATQIFSTGVDGASNVLPLGAIDTHYLSLTTGTNAYVSNFQLVGTWVQSPNSKWIWFNSSASGVGFHTFRTAFNLTASELASGLSLNGQYATDDFGEVFLNGGASSLGHSAGFSAFHSFSANSGFVLGTNYLDFVVHNVPAFGDPGGLNVKEVILTSGTAAPEPGTLGLLTLGISAGIATRRKGLGR